MTELTIEGMTCGHCRKAVATALEEVEGVTAVEVDLERGRARVTGNAELEHLVAAVENEGYRAAPAT